MSKVLLLSIFGAVAVGGGAVYLLVNDRPTDEMSDVTTGEVREVEEKDNTPVAGRGTLESLLSLAQNLECTVNYDADADAEVNGTYFTSSGKMRGDFVVNSEAGQAVSSVIMKDNTMYSWSEIDGEKYGVKFNLDEVKEAEQAGEAPDTREPVPLDADVDYSCKPWTSFDNSVFEPPSDIIFQDFSNILNAGMEFGTIYEETGGESDQCEMCSSIPAGAGRDACLAAFSC